MTVRLIDGNNLARRAFSEGAAGSAIRRLLADAKRGIWIWDGPGGVNLRRAKYPAYKMQRTPAVDSFYDMLKLTKELLAASEAIQVEVPNYEADDVIATLSRSTVERGASAHIVSNDGDFSQLVSDRITCDAKLKPGMTPELVRLYKVCVGDTADNISGIPGFGTKTWEGVSKHLLQKVIKAAVLGQVHPDLEKLQIPPRCIGFIRERPHDVKTLHEITGFYEVPTGLIDKHTNIGVKNPSLVSEIFSQYLMGV